MSTATSTRRPAKLLGLGNTKLGPLIYTWSMAALVTCPGASAACALVCYAKTGFFVKGTIAASYTRHIELSRQASFPAAIFRALRDGMARVVRIHVAGDFYDAAYVQKWIAVARRCPYITFFAYTRSWRVAEILLALAELAALPNVHLWYSEDRDTGPSPADPNVRVAFLVVTAADEALIDQRVDLVFRDRRHERLRPEQVKRLGGALVCPYEQSAAIRARVTCSSCRICFTARRRT